MSALAGLNHVAILTADLDRFIAFYTGMFDMDVVFSETAPTFRHAILRITGNSWLHPVWVPGSPHAHGIPRTFNRGHLDHLALTAATKESFLQLRQRLVAAGASEGMIEDLGAFHSLAFRDPDGMRGELTVIVKPDLNGIHEPRPLREAVT